MAEQIENTGFFGKLGKLFSSTAVVRIDKDGKRKVVYTEERQTNTNVTALRDRYTKLQRSFYESQAS